MRARCFSLTLGMIASFSLGADSASQAQTRLSTGSHSGAHWPQSVGPESIQESQPLSPPYRGGHHDPFDDLNIGLILTPELLYGWGGNRGYYQGGSFPSAPGGYSQPVLDQPPFYYGQPAPNYYSPAPSGAWSQSQYLTPQNAPGVTADQNAPGVTDAFRAPAQSPPAASRQNRETQRSATNAATPDRSVQRRKSILVRPESAPTLREDLAANSPGRKDYETSLAAFGTGDYRAAAVAAASAVAADSGDGKLHLYHAQCQFAVGDYAGSADSLTRAFEVLPPSQWGLVIENFRQFYRQNDYVPQVEKLLAFSEQPENRALGQALQAYHYHFLGHPDAATDQLRAALRGEAPPRLAVELGKVLLPKQPAGEELLPTPLTVDE